MSLPPVLQLQAVLSPTRWVGSSRERPLCHKPCQMILKPLPG